jgi:hypothetical protein
MGWGTVAAALLFEVTSVGQLGLAMQSLKVLLRPVGSTECHQLCFDYLQQLQSSFCALKKKWWWYLCIG